MTNLPFIANVLCCFGWFFNKLRWPTAKHRRTKIIYYWAVTSPKILLNTPNSGVGGGEKKNNCWMTFISVYIFVKRWLLQSYSKITLPTFVRNLSFNFLFVLFRVYRKMKRPGLDFQACVKLRFIQTSYLSWRLRIFCSRSTGLKMLTE